MKYVICVPDGCADQPLDELGGRTPLEAASMPTLAKLAARGEVGRAAVIPDGMPPGSDVGNMSILGYDPVRYHTGRAPIEAAAMGIELAPDQVAFRCNLVTVDGGTIVDFAGGHPSSEVAADVVHALDAELGSGAGSDLAFHPGVQYRHIVVAPQSWGDAVCQPPHDLTGKPVVEPSGPSAARLVELMEASRPVMAPFGLGANQIWLWGQGKAPQLPPFVEATGGRHGALCTAVDLLRGLGRLSGMDVVEVDGATGWFDTNYEGKRDAALRTLAEGADVFLLHVEATDEAGHAGNLDEKVAALEAWDSRILAGLVDGLDGLGPWRMLLLPDHPTPVKLRTHTSDSVPYLLVDRDLDGSGGVYSEPATAGAVAVPGHELLARLLSR
ncbi:MAG: cofactor-independent phosphoglycerate mutase [Acidimicrobiales bacterium]